MSIYDIYYIYKSKREKQKFNTMYNKVMNEKEYRYSKDIDITCASKEKYKVINIKRYKSKKPTEAKYLWTFLILYFFIFGLATSEAIYPKKTAAEIPPAAALIPPE